MRDPRRLVLTVGLAVVVGIYSYVGVAMVRWGSESVAASARADGAR